MDSIVEYLIKSALALISFYLLYWMLMRRSTHFGLNRLILATSLIASLILPLIKIDLTPEVVSTNMPVMSIDLKNVVQIVSKPEPAWGIREIVLLIYFSGLAITLFRLVYQAIYIHVITKMSRTITRGNHTIVLVDKDITPFAYFSKIFIPASKIDEASFESILAHEKSHLSQYHFIDLFIIELVTIIQWFNPIVWLYERSLKEVHEYMADDEVLKQGVPKGNYQALLVNQALGGPVFTISHQFNQSLILKRIIMMTKMKSPQLAKAKALLFIPLAAMLLMAFSNPEPIVNPVVEKVQSLTQQITDARLLPENLIAQNVSANEKGSIIIKGKVIDASTNKPIKGVNIIVQGTTSGTTSDENGAFEIKADGSSIFLVFSHISYTTSFIKYKSDNNIAVIKLNKGPHDLSAVTVNTGGNMQELDIKPYPYVLVDGVAVDEETFKALDANKIESVNILKDESATAVYGEKGKNGVILVVTKKENSKEEPKTTENKKSNTNEVFTIVEEMPAFPGGESERARFFAKNIRVPAESVEGTVYVSFIVKANGSVANAKILRGMGKYYDEEVLRVINLMPKWLPGTQNGQAVDVLFNLPVKFEKKK